MVVTVRICLEFLGRVAAAAAAMVMVRLVFAFVR